MPNDLAGGKLYKHLYYCSFCIIQHERRSYLHSKLIGFNHKHSYMVVKCISDCSDSDLFGLWQIRKPAHLKQPTIVVFAHFTVLVKSKPQFCTKPYQLYFECIDP